MDGMGFYDQARTHAPIGMHAVLTCMSNSKHFFWHVKQTAHVPVERRAPGSDCLNSILLIYKGQGPFSDLSRSWRSGLAYGTETTSVQTCMIIYSNIHITSCETMCKPPLSFNAFPPPPYLGRNKNN